ncbi:DUF3489 domain-containing protein [Methylobacterium oxalidis]|uniref:DUF3489 domain-containing protein n=1 Tax=Methylobacterium oxalidis TaxID=944322 RepID=A0A512J9R1_9HYPH|nr:DUF3489 domain-containing protein [Methylobacterium oxalidis]GEP06691.1 hypothetical protein MOX02_47290 [Methylobacterium oxalidis]GJE32924.1 hypothetical protein LDDCCGHA_3121 [Methylobacterium oxalidis]GLS67299.1 hypothetical protein GCM10007888_56820 [Methylobacterium oxalidis]
MHQSPALTPAQRDLLIAARQRADRLLTPPSQVRDRARQLMAERLVALGLAERVPVGAEQPAWQGGSSEDLIGLRLTAGGLIAIADISDGEATPDAIGQGQSEPAPAPAEPAAWTKVARLLALLRREDGADLAALAAATGWQSHTVRAALTGLRHKGYVLSRDKRAGDGVSLYRVAPR